MDPTQDTGNQLKEVESAAGNRNADELEVDGYYTGAPAGITAELLGLRPREHWPEHSYCWKKCLPFVIYEECVGEPRLRHFRPAVEPTTISKNEQLRMERKKWFEASLGHGHLVRVAWGTLRLSL